MHRHSPAPSGAKYKGRLSMKKLDKRTREALDTIKHGDTVMFYDCFEAEVYGKKQFIVQSENPEIYGGHVLVKLHGLGKFPIGKLKLVPSVEVCSYDEVKMITALKLCAGSEFPRCDDGCPYQELGIGNCAIQLLKDSNDYIERMEKHIQSKGAKNECV